MRAYYMQSIIGSTEMAKSQFLTQGYNLVGIKKQNKRNWLLESVFLQDPMTWRT